MPSRLKSLASYLLNSKFKSFMNTNVILNGELTIGIIAGNLENAVKFLRNDKKYSFKMLMSISGVDYPAREERFEVIYHMLSLENNLRIRIKICIKENEIVPSLSNFFASANWYEREVWDMFGIFFSHHPDLRRILTDYEFEGHPLRKDFPLTGYNEVRYDMLSGKVIYESVTLIQDFRNFDFESPWEEVTNTLPGDEKALKNSQ